MLHMLKAARLQMLKFKSNLPDQDPFENFDESFKQVQKELAFSNILQWLLQKRLKLIVLLVRTDN